MIMLVKELSNYLQCKMLSLDDYKVKEYEEYGLHVREAG